MFPYFRKNDWKNRGNRALRRTTRYLFVMLVAIVMPLISDVTAITGGPGLSPIALASSVSAIAVGTQVSTGGGRTVLQLERYVHDRYALGVTFAQNSTYPGYETRIGGTVYIRPDQKGAYAHAALGASRGSTPHLTWTLHTAYVAGGYSWALTEKTRLSVELGLVRQNLNGSNPSMEVHSRSQAGKLSLGLKWIN